MATPSELELNDVVLVTDLASTSTRGIHPALGRIIGFLDPERRSQAIVKYSQGQVNRPISKLVCIVKANETIPAKGKCFYPLAKADEQLQEEQADQGVGPLDLTSLQQQISRRKTSDTPMFIFLSKRNPFPRWRRKYMWTGGRRSPPRQWRWQRRHHRDQDRSRGEGLTRPHLTVKLFLPRV